MKKTNLVILIALMTIVACGQKAPTKMIANSTSANQNKKDVADTQTPDPKKTNIEGETAAAKPAIKLPTQFTCEARDSVWYSVAKIIKVQFTADWTDKPSLQMKSDQKELNFQLGREFIEGEKINMQMTPECENQIEHTDQIYGWTYTCRYFVIDADGSKKAASLQKSYFKVFNTGSGQLCRVVDEGRSQCWDLSFCK